MYYTYILKIKDQSYYIGSTQHVDSRLRRHQNGGSVYTKSRRPVQLVYQEEFNSRSEAVRRERQLKSWKSRVDIDKLVSGYGPIV